MVKKRTCIFISGKTNLKNLSIVKDNNFPIKISLVISNNKNTYGIKYTKVKIPYIFINTKIIIMRLNLNKFKKI